jgi:tetratricopeptide (TPR) repeat protein
MAEQIDTQQVQQLGAMANASRESGKYDLAEYLFRQALAIAERVLGADDRVVMELLNDLGVTHKYQGRYDEAEQCYWRAMAIAPALLGPDHPDVATLYHNLGGLEHARGRYAFGEPLARRAVAIREQRMCMCSACFTRRFRSATC